MHEDHLRYREATEQRVAENVKHMEELLQLQREQVALLRRLTEKQSDISDPLE